MHTYIYGLHKKMSLEPEFWHMHSVGVDKNIITNSEHKTFYCIISSIYILYYK